MRDCGRLVGASRDRGRLLALGLGFLGVILGGAWERSAYSQSIEDPRPVGTRDAFVIWERTDGVKSLGTVRRGPEGGFVFKAEVIDQGGPVPLSRGMVLDYPQSPDVEDRRASAPPYRVQLGLGQQISGHRFEFLDGRLNFWTTTDPEAMPVVIDRAHFRSMTQRPGEVILLTEDFEGDPAPIAGTLQGNLSVEPSNDGQPGRSLRVPVTSAGSWIRDLPTPLESGRVSLRFEDPGLILEQSNATLQIEMEFHDGVTTSRRRVTTRVRLDRDLLGVSAPRGPDLAVQPLERSPGLHVWTCRFGPEGIQIGLDGRELAFGRQPIRDPLTSIGVVLKGAADRDEAGEAAFRIDDLQVVRAVAPPIGSEADPSQDEVRLASGDQLFGRIVRANPESVALTMLGQTIALPWSEVSGLYLERTARASRPVEGPFVAVTWRPGGSASDADDPDRIEGALREHGPEFLGIESPMAGSIRLPRSWIQRLVVLDPVRRTVLDVHARHFGDQYDDNLDPPLNDDDGQTWTVVLDAVSKAPTRLVLDVVEVLGPEGDRFSVEVRDGKWLTEIFLNGQRLDAINSYAGRSSPIPKRIRIPIPEGRLRIGENQFRLEQYVKPKSGDMDDLGVETVLLEEVLNPE